MTLKEITFDILRLLQKSKLVDDSRLSTRHIQYKINQYRASGIRETFQQWGEIEPIWIQSLGTSAVTTTKYKVAKVGQIPGGVVVDGKVGTYDPDSASNASPIQVVTPETTTITEASGVVTFTQINSADDPNISGCDCVIGKFVMPEIVSLPGKRGSFHDRGIFRVATASRQLPYHPTSINRFYSMAKGSYRAK